MALNHPVYYVVAMDITCVMMLQSVAVGWIFKAEVAGGMFGT